MIRAAVIGRADVIALLLSLGVAPDVADEGGVRALQRAIGSDSRDIVELLLAHGAEIDRPSKHYGGGMGFAAHFGRKELAERMAPYSRDVHNLVNIGMKSRLVELFAAEPALANCVHPRGGMTPLFAALPGRRGAGDGDGDAAARAWRRPSSFATAMAFTAIDMAARRGLLDVADLLETGPASVQLAFKCVWEATRHHAIAHPQGDSHAPARKGHPRKHDRTRTPANRRRRGDFYAGAGAGHMDASSPGGRPRQHEDDSARRHRHGPRLPATVSHRTRRWRPATRIWGEIRNPGIAACSYGFDTRSRRRPHSAPSVDGRYTNASPSPGGRASRARAIRSTTFTPGTGGDSHPVLHPGRERSAHAAVGRDQSRVGARDSNGTSRRARYSDCRGRSTTTTFESGT